MRLFFNMLFLGGGVNSHICPKPFFKLDRCGLSQASHEVIPRAAFQLDSPVTRGDAGRFSPPGVVV